MNTTTNIYRMSERIAKLANTNLLEVARGMSDDKTIINYCREKVVRTKLDNLLEKDIWDFVKRPTGDLYTKQNGAEKWFIKVQNNKVTRAKKTIDGVEYPLNTSIIQNFKKKMKLEAVKQRITITKTGDYPATYIKGKDVDTVFTVKLGDRGVIKSENNKGAFVWLDKSFETLVFVNKNNYR